jgi:hypothetical protein
VPAQLVGSLPAALLFVSSVTTPSSIVTLLPLTNDGRVNLWEIAECAGRWSCVGDKESHKTPSSLVYTSAKMEFAPWQD